MGHGQHNNIELILHYQLPFEYECFYLAYQIHLDILIVYLQQLMIIKN